MTMIVFLPLLALTVSLLYLAYWRGRVAAGAISAKTLRETFNAGHSAARMAHGASEYRQGYQAGRLHETDALFWGRKSMTRTEWLAMCANNENSLAGRPARFGRDGKPLKILTYDVDGVERLYPAEKGGGAPGS